MPLNSSTKKTGTLAGRDTTIPQLTKVNFKWQHLSETHDLTWHSQTSDELKTVDWMTDGWLGIDDCLIYYYVYYYYQWLVFGFLLDKWNKTRSFAERRQHLTHIHMTFANQGASNDNCKNQGAIPKATLTWLTKVSADIRFFPTLKQMTHDWPQECTKAAGQHWSRKHVFPTPSTHNVSIDWAWRQPKISNYPLL